MTTEPSTDTTPAPTPLTASRWQHLMATWGFAPNHDTYEALVSAYAEPWRHYHTATHISACLGHLDACADHADAPHEVELALWFHDSIYKPLSGQNERKSADWAAAFLAGCGASQSTQQRVHRLIMATAHDAPTQTRDESILVDIDLSILGVDPVTYDQFEGWVRREYRMVPGFIYRKKRAAVLRGFAQRPAIYQSGCFPAARERQAKDNLARTITALES